MYIINPEPWSVPCYRIGPFRTKDIADNNRLKEDNTIDYYFSRRFENREFCYMNNGRSAIGAALDYYNLNKKDIVTIFTTTGNKYIAKCVTDEISKTCRWSLKLEPETKILLVNHEFGYPYSNLNSLKKLGFPIIEDFAHSFFLSDRNKFIGKVGDFSIYSFSKIFPIQLGGLLVSNLTNGIKKKNQMDVTRLNYIKKVLSFYIKQKEEIIETRLNNYNYLKNKFESLGFYERFKQEQGVVPGVFMFRSDEQSIDLTYLKKFFYCHGVQCSVFYGEQAFYIPVHQALVEHDMNYFYEVMKSFLQSNRI